MTRSQHYSQCTFNEGGPCICDQFEDVYLHEELEEARRAYRPSAADLIKSARSKGMIKPVQAYGPT